MSKSTAQSPIRPMLAKVPLFARLADEQISAISRLFVMSEVASGERLLMQGDPVESFLVVHKGELALLRSSTDGRERIVATLRPGMHFGLAEMITGAGSAVALRAEKASTLGIISKEAFRRVVLADPQLCYTLMQTMARSIFRLVRELDHATFESVPQRLARTLLAMAGAGLATAKGIQILPAPTHQDLANLVGASRETITRALGRMRDDGLIDLGYRQITIIDRDGLEDVVTSE